MVRVRVVVSGRVQGVYFRGSAAHHAEIESVGGFVRNRADGTVEAEFEGDRAAVDAMVSWCRAGPPGAAVESVDVAEIAPEGVTEFAIL